MYSVLWYNSFVKQLFLSYIHNIIIIIIIIMIVYD